MSGAYYFFSDVHLGLESAEKEKLKERKLVEFLHTAAGDAEEIFIVGDLFDCWIEYKQVVPRGYYRLFNAISGITGRGIKINYIAGNHDFWKGNFFKEEFGIEICHTHIEREIEGKKFFIHHGDGFAYNDFGYRILKKILRSSISQKLYSFIHPDLGIYLAKGTSATSRHHTKEKDYSEQDGMKDRAFEKIMEGFDYVIMGHRHKPQITSYENGYYINLGDWIDYFTYGVFREGRFELKTYYDLKSETTENKVQI
ncbi:MAG: UDP-2,3-diacylglucosamine diphosphatase [Ignavibacteria bacterium]|nr:UDP-2,3-diacylglucosamine diphosphatase [Ignavibacteria bacterium]